ncbi:CBO0543 family protein [Metabacillus malikii]|uniref:Uncharacterized protein n=1 Tax=Metabacillus malikii TaxID=1504265 RepID=A0ABT9ZGW8_9BACI|nr:CBO0543 family protein [Metabacillus malikii]MDQ0231051.1 hypothetical protein [Metabacillus malikii]
MRERLILKFLLILGIGLIPFVFERKYLKDGIIIFMGKGLLAIFLDTLTTGKKKIKYPIRFLPNYFRSNILFDLLLFPLVCVFYNRITREDKYVKMLWKASLTSLTLTIIEVYFEANTRLINFKNSWRWYHTFLSETVTLLLFRLFIGIIRKFDDGKEKGMA